MYVTERMIALFTYSIFLGIICVLITLVERKYIGKILSIYTLLLTTMSFFYVPASGADLYRLTPIMYIWADLSFSELCNELIKSTTPTSILYMYLIGQTKVDGLLPSITAFIFYRNVFILLKKSVVRFNVSANDASLILFYFMSLGVLIEVISGIRTMLGLSIIAVCMYREMIEGKSILKNVVWYLIASLIHPAVFVMTLLRISYMLFEKNKNTFQKISKVLILLSSLGILFFFGLDYLLASLDKGQEYFFNGSYSYIWEYVIGGISLFIVLLTIFLSKRFIKIEGDTASITNLYGFIKYLSMLIIVVSVEYNTFHRFVIFLSIISIPLLMKTLKSFSNQNNIRYLLFQISCILLILASVRGNLTSLKFFEF